MADEFLAANHQSLVGRTIAKVVDVPNVDEGFEVAFTDGSVLRFTFRGGEGTIEQESPIQAPSLFGTQQQLIHIRGSAGRALCGSDGETISIEHFKENPAGHVQSLVVCDVCKWLIASQQRIDDLRDALNKIATNET